MTRSPRRKVHNQTASAAIAALVLSICLPASALEEGIFLDPKTGNYVVRFLSEDQIREGVFYPRTKIDPTVSSKTAVADDSSIIYQYSVNNKKTGRQDIRGIDLYAVHAFVLDQSTPAGHWRGLVTPDSGGTGYLVGWVYLASSAKASGISARGLPPGSNKVEFGIRSTALPGVGFMRFQGSAPITMLPDEGPDPETPVGKAYSELRQNDFVPRLAAIPRIANPTPFDAVTVLTGVQKHVNDDLVGMKLVDTDFASRLNQGLVSAIEAAKRGNTESLRSELKKLRHQLKGFGEPADEGHAAARKGEGDEQDQPEEQIQTKDWPHPIAKLAARVLDFDLQYVEKRVKGALE